MSSCYITDAILIQDITQFILAYMKLFYCNLELRVL